MDLDDPRNRDPRPDRESMEFMSVVRVPLRDLPARLGRMREEGLLVETKLFGLALGLLLAREALGPK